MVHRKIDFFIFSRQSTFLTKKTSYGKRSIDILGDYGIHSLPIPVFITFVCICMVFCALLRWYAKLFCTFWWYRVEKRLGTPDVDFENRTLTK